MRARRAAPTLLAATGWLADMDFFAVCWLFGEGIVIYRSAKTYHAPPGPGTLLASSGLFVLLALLAEYPPARRTAIALALGFDLTGFLALTSNPPKAKTGLWPPAIAGNAVIIPDGTAASMVSGTDTEGSGGGGTLTAATTSSSGGAGSSTGSAGAGGSASANQAVAKAVIAANAAFAGWGSGSQFQCLVNLWNQESGWSTSAVNSGSGAQGIAQALGHGSGRGHEYGGYGLTAAQAAAANAGSAADQILWGLNYILSTYKTPCGAWAHEQANDWY